MEEAKSEHESTIKNCQRSIAMNPMNAYHLSLKIAALMNQIANIQRVIEVCKTLDPEDSILKE